MAKMKLKPVSSEKVNEQHMKMLAFLEQENYSYVITDDGFLVGIKTFELVPDTGIIAPPSQGLIK